MKRILVILSLFLICATAFSQVGMISNRKYNLLDTRLTIAESIQDGDSLVVLQNGSSVALTDALCINVLHVNNAAGAIDFTLPPARLGLVVMFYDIVGGIITVDVNDAVDTIYLNGTSIGAGDAIDSPGVAGNYICLVAIDNTRWITLGQEGTWVDGGTD
jgi:hypothetical protein